MKPAPPRNPAILAVLFPAPRLASSLGLLEKHFGLANWLGAELNLLLPPGLLKMIDAYLSKRPELSRSLLSFREVRRDYLRETLSAAQELKADYLSFEDGDIGSAGADATQLARTKQKLLERSPIPVLVLPRRLPRKFPQIHSLIVPISGEQRRSQALEHALRIAEATRASVTLVHVSRAGQRCSCGNAGLECVGDQVHHEYLQQIDKVVSEGSPGSTLRQRRRVTGFAHLSGGTHAAISRFARRAPDSMLVLEWKGTLLGEHAKTLKELLGSASSPVLITKLVPPPSSRLKFGSEFEAA